MIERKATEVVSMTWQDKLQQHKSAGLWRTHQIRTGPQPAHSFNSNDYLGLSNHPEVIEAFKQAADQYGVGSGSANTLSGYTTAHDELRQTLREWLGRDDVLLFSSGYQANLAVLTTLISKDDHVFADKLNHASLNDGMRFSGARFTRYSTTPDALRFCNNPGRLAYNHNSPRPPSKGADEYIHGPLQRGRGALSWIITESLFSMDGHEACLKKLSELNAQLIIDEAHSLGLYGPQGSGLIVENGLTQQQVPIMVGTFGKAIGTQGAFVAGDQTYIDALMQFGRPYLFTTAMAPALAAATSAAIQLVRKADQARGHLRVLISDFREKASKLGLRLSDSASPIQPIIFDQIDLVNRLSEKLGISSIRYPTVALNAPRLRISLTANHTREWISHFLETLKEALDEETSHTNCI